MRRLLVCCLVVFTFPLGAGLRAEEKAYPYRWVYVICEQFEPGTADKVREIAKTCAEHGVNGMVLSGALDRLDLESPYTFKAIAEIKRIADHYGVEIIPQVMGVGYNAFMPAHDKNLAEGLPVRDTPCSWPGPTRRTTCTPASITTAHSPHKG